MSLSPLVTVVIVTWNNENDIYDCLKSIYEQDYDNYNIVVIDNASKDNTKRIIKDSFPQVELIEKDKNLFLTGGNNAGIKYALKQYDSEYILVLNPDTYSPRYLISELVKPFHSAKKIGAVGPKVKFWKNKNEDLINSAGIYYDGFMQAYDIGFKEEDNGQYDEQKEVFGVTGACIMYKADMLKEIGLYENLIKMYLDEVELFIKAHKHGWNVIYTPEVTLGHNYMQSTTQNKSFNREKQLMKAWLIIAFKHYSLKSKLAMLKHYIKFRITKELPE